jgi:putative ABC transport system permease protein
MNCLFMNGDRSFYEDHGYYADSSFLEILSFDLASGDATTALDEPNSIVITQKMATKYFGKQNPMGATLLFNNELPLKVTGIMSVIPSNSHLNFDFLISFSTYVIPAGYSSDLESWNWLGFLTYVELQAGSDRLNFQDKLENLFANLNPDDTHPMKPKVQKLSEIYLGSSHMSDDLSSHIRSGNQISVYALMTIALLIVLIAAFNYANLTNAISLNRGKATGIRKTLGAQNTAVLAQVITESLVLAICCMLISYGLAMLIFPKIAALLSWGMYLDVSEVVSTIPIMLLVTLLLGVLAGIYPAIFLSRLNIIKSLKGDMKARSRHPFQLKNVLIMAQFSISIGLISATLVLSQQIDYLTNRATGFDKENVAVIKLLPEDMSRFYEVFKEQLIGHAGIINISNSERVVGEPWPFSGIRRADQDGEQWKMTYFNLVGHDYFKTMDIHLTQGRTFSKENAGDSQHAVVINQEAARLLSLKDPIGEQVYFFSGEDGPRTIIGVVEDFNYTSLHQEIGPVAMVLPFTAVEYIYVRLTPGNITEHIALLENTWSDVAEGTPLEWRFLDDTFDQLYTSEERLSVLIGAFSMLAVFLACLGLYGIVAYIISNRIKELGIRKVLGASMLSLNIIFVKQYVYQILLAMALVVPILHLGLHTWLQQFAYRIDISWWTYPLATLILMAIAFCTIGYQATRAAQSDPVKVLKNE